MVMAESVENYNINNSIDNNRHSSNDDHCDDKSKNNDSEAMNHVKRKHEAIEDEGEVVRAVPSDGNSSNNGMMQQDDLQKQPQQRDSNNDQQMKGNDTAVDDGGGRPPTKPAIIAPPPPPQAAAAAGSSRKTPGSSKPVLCVKSSAVDICSAFFTSMDFDNNGYIEEEESKILSIVAFDKNEIESDIHWHSMLKHMDTNNDKKISKQEYVEWWLKHYDSQGNINPNDGTFIEEHAIYLLKCLQRVSSVKVAKKMCDAFFDEMDMNGDGYLVEDEIKTISRWAFSAKEEEANERWLDMLHNMDYDNDNKISKQEYSDYWMNETKNKIKPDGTFVDGYRHYLLKQLVKIKAGNKRQQQIKKWDQIYNNNDDSNTNTNEIAERPTGISDPSSCPATASSRQNHLHQDNNDSATPMDHDGGDNGSSGGSHKKVVMFNVPT